VLHPKPIQENHLSAHRRFLKVKSFDPKVVTGSKPAGVLLDELHVIARRQRRRASSASCAAVWSRRPRAFW